MAYPSDTELTQLSTLRHWLGIPASETSSDAFLTALIPRVSAAVISYLQRPSLVLGAVVELHNGNGRQKLIPFTQPISSITSLVINGTAIPASTAYNISGYVFSKDRVYLRDYYFAEGYQNVVLTMQAGFATTSSELKAIEQAVLATCALWWKKRVSVDKASQSITGLGSVTTGNSSIVFPAEAKAILDIYRKKAPRFE